MKKVLSPLLVVAFLESQALALSGGPVYPNGGATGYGITGTYAGVLVPRTETNPSNNKTSAAAIGVFSLGVPTSGIAQGDAVVFIDGVAYTGNIVGVVDPNQNTLTGIMEGTSDYQIVSAVPTNIAANGTVTFTEERTNAFAQGNIEASISQAFVPSAQQSAFSDTGIVLNGTADLDIFATLNADGSPDVTNTVAFDVTGFLQSATVTTSTITFNLNPNGNNNNNNGTGS